MNMGLPRSFCDAPATSPTWTVDFYPTDGRKVPKASKEGPHGATHKTQSPSPRWVNVGWSGKWDDDHDTSLSSPGAGCRPAPPGPPARVELAVGRAAYRGLPLGGWRLENLPRMLASVPRA